MLRNLLGSYYKNKHTGTFGDFGCLSFNGNKVVTTGAGGLVILKRKSDFIKATSLANVSKKKFLIFLILMTLDIIIKCQV